MESETKYAKSGDVHIAYRVFGDGPSDILLVPGTLSHVEQYWELAPNQHLLNRLSSFARVIVFDKRGQGLSDRVAEQTIEERMSDALAVMDAAGSRRATVYGWSEGGQMSLMLAAKQPERVTGVAVYGAYASIRSEPWSVSPQAYAKFLAHVAKHWGEGIMLKITAPSRIHDGDFIRWFSRLERAVASPGAILALMRANYELDSSGILDSIRVPVLVMHRAGDALVPVQAGRYLAWHIPRASYFELPGDDHLLQAFDQEVLDLLIDRIEEFVTGARAPRRSCPQSKSRHSNGSASVHPVRAVIDAPLEAPELGLRGETTAPGGDVQQIDEVLAGAQAVAAASLGLVEKLDSAITTFRRHFDFDVPPAGADFHNRTESGANGFTTAASEGLSVFQREGDYWTLAWQGHLVRLKDLKGFRYINY